MSGPEQPLVGDRRIRVGCRAGVTSMKTYRYERANSNEKYCGSRECALNLQFSPLAITLTSRPNTVQF